MKKALSLLLMLCLFGSLFGAALADGLEGKPWVNPEWPENLPGERPALENDFYLYVNYDLHQKVGKGSDSEIGGVLQAEKEMRDALWELVRNGDSTEAKVLRILTGLIMDRERREKDGLEPLMAYVRRVQAVKSLEELSTLCREDGFLFGSPYARVDLTQSDKDPETFAIGIYFNEIVPQRQLNEGEEEPENEEEKLDKARVSEDLQLLGWDADSAQQMTERLVRYQLECYPRFFEYKVGENGVSIIPTAEETLKGCTPLRDQLVSQGWLTDESKASYFLMDVLPFQQMMKQYTDENLELFKAIVCLSMYRYAVDYLNPATYAKYHDFNADLDEKTAFDYMQYYARYLTEKAYADAYITGETRERIRELTGMCKQALADWMRQCEWLSEASRENAAKKALAMKVVIMNPEETVDYAPLLQQLSADGISLLEAATLYDQTNRKLLLTMAGKPYQRGHRFLVSDSMLQANAVYKPDVNAFYMMAGILLPMFYDSSSMETLLATLGQTIAHEMAHAFDPVCITYDADGQMASSPLTEDDLRTYQERALRLVEKLSAIEAADGVMLNGQRKIQEATADLLGLRVVLDLAAKQEGFDYDRFFTALARKFYRSFLAKEDALDNYGSDLHPPYYVRVNYTFAQFEAFYHAYPAVQEGKPMYIAPADRATLW
ncbi:MAG: hypothetical protein IJ174_00940 [Clostridia bacterium]|nr:hypothetical protein [Clostridia bacterium]